ncbi:MAG: DUF4386 domain-containing protein [Anaerolineae bacterium]|nr:DUF4386 domain-containing protein [Anaerolineae bacterium]
MTTHTAETSTFIYARVAGFTFLFYIAAGITSLALASQTQAADLLALLQNFSALVLGVTLYALTYKQGLALALLALTCRVLEAVHDESAIFFAVGSLLFSWLLLRGRMIPTALVQLGVFASALLVVILPLQLAGLFGGPTNWSESIDWLIWLPMLVFEVVLALWLLIKGVAMPSERNVTSPRVDQLL